MRAAGGVEFGAGHYPLFVVLHTAWLGALFVTVPPTAAIDVWWLGAFIAAQAGRIWIIASLGRFWTTRILSVPDEPLVRRGPYQFMRHPNYVVVAAEIALLPMVFGAWQTALVFSTLNAGLLAHRIRVEDAALESRRRR